MNRVLFCGILCSLFTTLAWAQEPAKVVSLTLRDALRKAYEINPQVLMADARAAQALAHIEEARASLLPQIDGVATISRQTRDLRGSGISIPGDPHVEPFNSVDARPRLTLSLFDPAAIERLHLAQKGGAFSKAQFVKLREDVLILVATLYMQAKRSAQTLFVRQQILRKDQEALRLAKLKYQQGTSSLLELRMAQNALALSRYLFSKAKAEFQGNVLDLGAALKIPTGQGISFVQDQQEQELLKQLTKDARHQESSALSLAKADLASQESAQSLAKADFFPRLVGVLDYGRAGRSFDKGSDTYSIGLQATIPIWEGGLQGARLEEAKARLRESQENLQDMMRHEEVATIEARHKLAEAQDLLLAKQAAFSVAQESLAVIQGRLASGLSSQMDLLEAQVSKALAQDDYREASAYRVMAQVNLIHALGHMEDFVNAQ